MSELRFELRTFQSVTQHLVSSMPNTSLWFHISVQVESPALLKLSYTTGSFIVKTYLYSVTSTLHWTLLVTLRILLNVRTSSHLYSKPGMLDTLPHFNTHIICNSFQLYLERKDNIKKKPWEKSDSKANQFSLSIFFFTLVPPEKYSPLND